MRNRPWLLWASILTVLFTTMLPRRAQANLSQQITPTEAWETRIFNIKHADLNALRTVLSIFRSVLV
jgi:hypothetical protein